MPEEAKTEEVKKEESVEVKYAILSSNSITLENGVSYHMPYTMSIPQGIAMLDAFKHILKDKMEEIEAKKTEEQKDVEEKEEPTVYE